MSDKISYEIEIYPGCWEDISPEHLYDSKMKTLASYGDIDPETVEGNCWWLSDFTKAPRCVRIKRS